MELPHNIKIEKTLQQNITSMQSGIFFATSYGKGPCDAIGGILKRMAGNASLAKEHVHPITSAKELYNWSNQKSNKNS